MPSVLLVDDETGMRELLNRWLLADGHHALEARTAEEALDLLGTVPDIAVVVADMQMPGHGGAWLVGEMQKRFPNVAVILATADQSVPGTVSLQPAVNGYIVKPVTSRTLLSHVASGLAWNAARRVAPKDAGQSSDPFNAWLDQKLNKGHGDGGDRG